MEPQIVRKPAFIAVGLKHRGQTHEAPKLWDQFIPRMGEVQHLAMPRTSYGIMGNYDPASGDYDYFAGLGVNNADELPVGMVAWTVPEQDYAVFPCTLTTLQDDYKQAYDVWLPQSPYQGAEGPMFELYDEHFPFGGNNSNSQFYIYVNIKPK